MLLVKGYLISKGLSELNDRWEMSKVWYEKVVGRYLCLGQQQTTCNTLHGCEH